MLNVSIHDRGFHKMCKYLLSHMLGHEYKASKFDKAIIALGSTENHGDHLPFATDTIIAQRIAEEVAMRVNELLLLPALPYGMSEYYSAFPLTISLRSETLIAVLKDILKSLLKHGIKKLIIVNGHDGNIPSIEIATREFRAVHPEMKIAVLEAWWITASQLLPKETFEVWDGLGHGGEGETSLMLALKPELVSIKHAKDVVPDLPVHIQIKWTFDELTSYGVTGAPSKATKEKGEKLREALVNLLVSFIKEMDAKDWSYGEKLDALRKTTKKNKQ
jgi:creatinine amidohydrolase